jgi:hypothetical protein
MGFEPHPRRTPFRKVPLRFYCITRVSGRTSGQTLQLEAAFGSVKTGLLSGTVCRCPRRKT